MSQATQSPGFSRQTTASVGATPETAEATLRQRCLAPVELLQALAGWLDESGFDAAHPWQVAIAATLAAAGASGNTPTADDHGAAFSSLDFFKLADRVHDLHALVQAINARSVEVQDDFTGSNDPNEPIRRLCDITAGLADCLASDIFEMAARFGRSTRQAEGGAA